MSLSKNLLLAGVAALVLSAPAFANDAPATGVGAASDAAAVPGAPSVTTSPVGGAGTLPVEDLNDPVGAAANGAPATLEEVPMDPTPAPVAEPTPESGMAPAEAPVMPDAAPVAPQTPAVEEQSAAPAEPAPVAEAPKPKKAPSAKLSALAKKYKLMDLDKDGNKSLSRAEFTADGFANDKVFGAYDSDKNGKLTNSEINAYAARIEANINK